jgi:hypothetical protein
MLRWQKPQSGMPDDMDEHNQPTEPVPHFPDPALPTLPGAGFPSQADLIPAPQQQEQPFPQQYVGNVLPPQPYQPQPYMGNVLPPQSYQPQYIPGAPPVPYAPMPAPLFGRRKGRRQRWRPEQPVAPIASVPTSPAPAPVGRRQRRMARKSPIPALIGLFFVFVQLVLVARFVLKIVNPPQTTVWIDITYALSSFFLLPALALMQQVKLPFSVGIELYTLPAILLYSVFSRILVKILRVFL